MFKVIIEPEQRLWYMANRDHSSWDTSLRFSKYIEVFDINRIQLEPNSRGILEYLHNLPEPIEVEIVPNIRGRYV